MGMTKKASAEMAGYSPTYDPMKSKLAKLTLEEVYALEGMDDHWLAKHVKNVAENANKYIAAGNTLEEEPDWQNRVRALELYAKTADKMSATKQKIEVDHKYQPFSHLSDEELKSELILEGEVLEDERYALLENTDNAKPNDTTETD